MAVEKARIDAVTAELRLDEKVALTRIVGGRFSVPFPALKIPSLKFPDDFAPFRRQETPFAALACAFDLGLTAAYGKAVSTLRAREGYVYGGTVPVGVLRTPTEENNCFGEDALLTQKQLEAYCAEAVLPFVGDELLPDGDDRYFDERALNELYLKPYFACRDRLGGVIVPRGNLNGKSCQTRAFTNLLDRAKPIFVRGYAVSDAVEAVRGGAFLTLDGAGSDLSAVFDAVRDGNLYEKTLDNIVAPLLALSVDYNEFRKNELPLLETCDTDAYRLRLAEISTTLLKNENALPDGDAVILSDEVRLIGRAAARVKDKHAVLVLHIDGDTTLKQKKLYASVRKTAKKVTLVLDVTFAVDLTFAENADAILYAPCFDQGVIERIVRGELSPSGRLPFTWSDPNAYATAIKRGNRDGYAVESVYVGYRYFDAFSVKPLYPFGHGLDYLDVDVTLGKPSVKGNVATIPFAATNRADRRGETTLLCYVNLPESEVFGIERRLAAFTRVYFSGAETVTGTFTVDSTAIEVFDTEENEYVVAGGKVTFSCGGATTDTVKFGKKVKLKGYGEKDVPSYFPSARFNPRGVDAEKLLKAKAYGETVAAAPKVTRRTVSKVCRKYGLSRADRPRVKRLLSRLPLEAVERIEN